MFSWLTGGQGLAADEPLQPGEDKPEHQDDTPETPAPVFAVRAFKQAIWGTPKPGPTVKRAAKTLPLRRGDDASRAGHRNVTPPSSPSKRPGILLTPGTAGKGRKSVSFGAQQRAQQSHRPDALHSNSMVRPDAAHLDFPISTADSNERKSAPSNVGFQSSTSQTHIRSQRPPRILESKPGDNKTETELSSIDDADEDLQNPRSASGRYWKSTHEAYAAKSEEQMRKMLKKEQVAKKFARAKDDEAAGLRRELEVERRNTQRLEARLAELTRKATDAALFVDGDAHGGAQVDAVRKPRPAAGGSGSQQAETVAVPEPETGVKRQANSAAPLSNFNAASSLTQQASSRSSRPRTALDGATSPNQAHQSSDIWAEASFPAPPRSATPQKRVSLSPYRAKPSREPLGDSHGNGLAAIKPGKSTHEANDAALDPSKENAAPPHSHSAKISQERREAAQRRLEERKRAREKKPARAGG